jgi:ribosomal protein S18 acetylase RimI-like enzyme
VVARDFEAGDLRTLQRLVQDAWAAAGPQERHIGDVAWAESHIPGRAATFRRRLWEEDGRVVAWGWIFLPDTLDWQVDPARPELVDEVHAWFESEVDARTLTTSALASHAPAVAAIRARGYEEQTGEPWMAWLSRDLDELPAPEVPAGYRLRAVTAADLERRVEVHRVAWEPSRVTAESYAVVRSTWPYRDDLDCVAEARDGLFAASVLSWLDDENRVGELEPVGTAPAHRRRGLAAAVSLFALHRLRDAGAGRAVVACRGDDAYPIPKRLYESIGFRQHDRVATFTKRR